MQTQHEVWKTCQEQWMIGTDGERESGKSVLAVRIDDDEDDETCESSDDQKRKGGVLVV